MSKKLPKLRLFSRFRQRQQRNDAQEAALADSKIVKAARAGDGETLASILKDGGSPSQDKLDLALYRAVQVKSFQCTNLLLEVGASPEAKPRAEFRNKYRPPIVIAVAQGCLDIARVLIKHNCCVDSVETGNAGFTALHYAISNKNEEAIQLLLDANADITRKGTDFTCFKSALFLAVEENYKTGLKMLLSSGMYVNHRDIDLTLLHRAVQCGYMDMVTMLIEMGADPNVTDCRCYTPLMEAVTKHQTEIVNYLAVMSDVNYRGQRDITALMLAAQVNAVEELRILLQVSADVNLRDTTGNTALTLAGPHMNALNLLLQAGADPNVQNGFGMTPLWYGAYYHHLDAVKALLRANASAEVKAKNFDDEYHTSALEIALKRHHWDISKLVILAGMTSHSVLQDVYNNSDTIIPRADNVRDSVRDLVKFVGQMLCTPRSLKFWCRKVIRYQLGSVRVNVKVENLPVPEAIKVYLGIPELDDPEQLKSPNFL